MKTYKLNHPVSHTLLVSLIITLTLLIFVFVSTVYAAYVIEQTSHPLTTPQAREGQTFTTIGADKITQIDIYVVGSSGTTDLRIYSGSQSPGTPGTALYVQNSIPIACSNCWVSVSLTTPLAVSAATQYTFEFTNISLGFSSSDPYAGGVSWENGASFSGDDLAFRVYIIGEVPEIDVQGNGQSIPTATSPPPLPTTPTLAALPWAARPSPIPLPSAIRGTPI